MKQSLYAFSILVGTIIGVGLFGLPYVAMKSGFLVVVVYFIIIGLLIWLLQLIYGQICLLVKNGGAQLPGHTEQILGKQWKPLAALAMIASIYGALLAYIIIGGKFLSAFLMPYFGGTEIFYQIIFFAIGAILVYRGIHSIASTEFFMLIFMIAMIALLFILNVNNIHLQTLQTSNLRHVFFPYGVVIFSLWGINIIPTVQNYLNRDAKKLKKITSAGILFCTIVYLVFIVAVFGVSGSKTSADALTGLVPFLSNKVLVAGYIFGILTTFTSFIALGHAMSQSFFHDYQLPHEWSWFLTFIVPLVLFALGMTNFLAVVNLTGAFALALQGILIGAMYLKAQTNQKLQSKMTIHIPRIVVFTMIAVLLLGIGSEVYYSFLK